MSFNPFSDEVAPRVARVAQQEAKNAAPVPNRTFTMRLEGYHESNVAHVVGPAEVTHIGPNAFKGH